jgi:hypothetical protein
VVAISPAGREALSRAGGERTDNAALVEILVNHWQSASDHPKTFFSAVKTA